MLRRIKGIIPELLLLIALIVGIATLMISLSYHAVKDEKPTAVTVAQAPVVEVAEPAPYEPLDLYEKGMLDNVYSLYDLYEIVALVILEAGDQSNECQRAVASVIFNRVNSPYYPNTTHKVITQHGQYEPVIKGKTEYYIDVMENNEDISDEEAEDVERALENVLYVIHNGNTLPSDDYLYQAQFNQGVDVIEIGSEKFGRKVK